MGAQLSPPHVIKYAPGRLPFLSREEPGNEATLDVLLVHRHSLTFFHMRVTNLLAASVCGHGTRHTDLYAGTSKFVSHN